jgi:molecular chaperone Hsp33
MSDQGQRFLFDEFAIRGELVQLNKTLREIFSNHEYPEPVKRLIGEFATAAALLSATIKFNGSLILQVKGAGQVSMLMAECRDQQSLRAIASYKDYPDPEQPLIGDGQMAIIIEPDEGESYQGIVLVEDNNLSEVLEKYFLHSEQLRTRIWLSAQNDQAAGLLLQSMPESASESSLTRESEDWNRICMLADTITDEELLGLTLEQILTRLFHQEKLRLFEPRQLAFECTCSKERSANTLFSLGETEVRTLLSEEGGTIEIDCQFCHARYRFDELDLNKIFGTQVH